MKQLDVDFTSVENFDNLSGFDVLVIGANSLDTPALASGGGKIEAWLKDGGRLLQFDQSFLGTLSYLRNMSITVQPAGGGNVASMIVPEHPVFDKISDQENWDTWSIQKDFNPARLYTCGRFGGIWDSLVGPLNKTMLAVGCSEWRNSGNTVQIVIGDAKVGKGVALVSQAKAVSRYGKDSVATKFVQNCLKYIISDETRFSEPLSVPFNAVDYHECGYLEMEGLPKSPLSSDADWLKMVNEGVAACGGLHFKMAKCEAILVNDKVSFALPLAMKLMDPEWEAKQLENDKNQKGLMRNCVRTLYVMAAFTGEIPDKAPALKIVINYVDGTTAERTLLAGQDIAAVGSHGDLEGAPYVGNGFHVVQWLMPDAEKPVKEIVFVPSGNVIIGGVTASLVREQLQFTDK